MTGASRQGTADPEAGTPRFAFLSASGPAPEDPRSLFTGTQTSGQLLRRIIVSALPYALPGALIVALGAFAETLIPVLVGTAVDRVLSPVIGGRAWQDVLGALGLVLLGLALVYGGKIVGERFGGRLGWFAMQRTQYFLGLDLISRLLRGHGHARLPGEILSRVTSDVQRAARVLFVLVYPPGEVIALLSTTVILWSLDVRLALVVVVGAPVMLVLMNRMGGALERRSEQELESLGQVAATASDILQGLGTVQGLRAEKVAARRYQRDSGATLRVTLAARSTESAFDGVVEGVSALFVAILVGTAAWLALAGEISVGALTTVAGLSVNVIGPLGTVTTALVSFWATGRGAAGRLIDLAEDAGTPAPGTGDASGNGRSAEADGSRAAPGTTGSTGSTAGQGPSGSRGTSRTSPTADPAAATDGGAGHPRDTERSWDVVARVLELARHPERGHGMVAVRASDAGSVMLRAALQETAGEQVLIAPRAPEILAGTVAENVALGAGGHPSTRGVREALTAASLQEAELAQGYETDTGEGGSSLSGGQRQRVALARALARRTGVLVLEEPTTSVDAVTEHRIATNLSRFRRGRTTIVITTSPVFHTVADHSWECMP